MSAHMKISFYRNNIIIAVILVIILPTSFIIISYLFQDDVILDKPKLLEELAKSVVALLLYLTNIFVSRALRQKEISRKSQILRYQVRLEVGLLGQLTDEVKFEEELLNEFELINSSADVIRKNFNKQEQFRILVEKIKERLDGIYHNVMSEPLDVRMNCFDYIKILSECISTSEDFLDRPSSPALERIKEYLSNLQNLIEKEDCNVANKET